MNEKKVKRLEKGIFFESPYGIVLLSYSVILNLDGIFNLLKNKNNRPIRQKIQMNHLCLSLSNLFFSVFL